MTLAIATILQNYDILLLGVGLGLGLDFILKSFTKIIIIVAIVLILGGAYILPTLGIHILGS